jgi:hypothetical protein
MSRPGPPISTPASTDLHASSGVGGITCFWSFADFYGAQAGGEIWGRLTIHYTPTHGSWLNQAEIEIGTVSRQCLGTRRIPDLKTLRRESRAWNRRTNRAHTKINRKFDRKAARRKFGYQKNSFTRSKT